MKKNAIRIKAGEPAPIDSIDLIERNEFDRRIAQVIDMTCEENNLTRRQIEFQIEKLKQKDREIAIVGGVIAAALCFVMMIKRRDN